MNHNPSTPPFPVSVAIHADQPAGPSISRLLFGKFTEHLGRNVYGGAWAETIENPWFAPVDAWSKPDVQRQRLQNFGAEYGLPDMGDAPDAGLAAYWIPKGAIRAALEPGLRGHAQRITTGAPGSGIRTVVFLPLHRQRGYRFTIRGRASRTTRVIARLLTLRGEELAWCDAALTPGPWHTVQRTLRLAPARESPSGSPLILDMQLEHPVTIWFDRCSLIPADDRYGWDPEVVSWMKEAQLPLLRFPGGNFSSGYHWRDGVGPIDSRPILPNPAWPEIEWNEVGTDEWLLLCHLAGCVPLICVNGGDGTPEEAAAWVEYCNGSVETPMGGLRAANGHPPAYNVKYWEVGNELYGAWQIGHTPAGDYAERYLAFREAMLAADPSIHIIANGHDAEWNRTVVERAGDKVASLSVHTLAGHHIPAESDPEAVFREYMGFAADYGNHLAALAAPMREAGLTPRLAITELSIFTLKPPLPNVDNLSEALYYSGIVNAAIRSEGLVELITHSALINHSAGLVKQRGIVYPHPMWWALHLYGTHTGIQPVSVHVDGPVFSCSGQWLTRVENAPTTDVVALMSQDLHTLVIFVTNRDSKTPASVRLSAEGFASEAHGTVSILAGESFMARNTWDATEHVRLRTHAVRLEDGMLEHTLPPHSLTRIVLGR